MSISKLHLPVLQWHYLLYHHTHTHPPPRADVSLISKFSQLEYRHGEPERGRTMFESLLSSYPKRVDLWSVYIDVVLKSGDTLKVR